MLIPKTTTALPSVRKISPLRTQTRFVSVSNTPRFSGHDSQASDRFLYEIHEQLHVLAQQVQTFPSQFELLERFPEPFHAAVTILGEGSSYNAARMTQPYLEALSDVPFHVMRPSELHSALQRREALFRNPFRSHFFFAVSQSGNTASVLSAIQALQQRKTINFPLLPFVNDPKGQLASLYPNHVLLGAGAENSIAATKSMTAAMMALLLSGLYLGIIREHLPMQNTQQVLDQLLSVSTRMNEFLSAPNLQKALSQLAAQMADSNVFVLLSQGPLVDMLPETGLKLAETSGNMVHVNNTESFKHGPKVVLGGVGQVTPNTVYWIPPNLSAKQSETFFNDVRSHFVHEAASFPTDRIFFIRFENSPPVPQDLQRDLKIPSEHILTLPETRRVKTDLEALFVGIAAMQRLSHALAEARGVNPNHVTLPKVVV